VEKCLGNSINVVLDALCMKKIGVTLSASRLRYGDGAAAIASATSSGG
jgi:hypothetical protein